MSCFNDFLYCDVSRVTVGLILLVAVIENSYPILVDGSGLLHGAGGPISEPPWRVTYNNLIVIT